MPSKALMAITMENPRDECVCKAGVNRPIGRKRATIQNNVGNVSFGRQGRCFGYYRMWI